MMTHIRTWKWFLPAALVGILSSCDGGTLEEGADALAGISAGEGESGVGGVPTTPDGTTPIIGEDGEPIDPTADTDGDLIYDINDNCPQTPNPGQEDYDGDETGNACDIDLDGDLTPNADDCAPFDPLVHPGAAEKCNSVDDNCNGITDEEPEEGCTVYYPDNDADSTGPIGEGVCLCAPSALYVTPFGGDCDDFNGAVGAFHAEACDNVDNNCNTLIDEGCDDDGDLYCDVDYLVVGAPEVCPLGGGDCFDYSALVNPDAAEIPGDGIDNNCDGVASGEAGGEFTVICPDDCLAVPNEVDRYLCAMEMCFDDLISNAYFDSPSGDDHSTAHAVVEQFGSDSNDLVPFGEWSYGLLATGPALGTSHSVDLPGGSGGGCDIFGGGGSGTPDPFAQDGFDTFDNVEFIVEMTAPATALGFCVDFVFFSEEYEEWIGSDFNDKFYIILTAPQTTFNEPTVINTTECSNPSAYYDKIDEWGDTVCYIAINTSFSEACPNAPTDISGTGYECAANGAADSSSTGSSTGWLETCWPIGAGESFKLVFHIHDSSDGVWDSEVILDNFRFETVPGEFNAGTTTAN